MQNTPFLRKLPIFDSIQFNSKTNHGNHGKTAFLQPTISNPIAADRFFSPSRAPCGLQIPAEDTTLGVRGLSHFRLRASRVWGWQDMH